MTLAWPVLGEALRFTENSANVLVIENRAELRRLVFSFIHQTEGLAGELVYAEKDEIKELSKSVLFISDPFSLDFSSRKLSSKINQDACKAGAEFSESFFVLMQQLNSLGHDICGSLDYDASFEPLENFDELIKLMGFYIDRDELGFPEQLLEYIKLQRLFFNKKLFVFYNLKACLSPEELKLFYRSVFYEKLHILLIEDSQRYSLKDMEKTLIIDKDLCVF